MCILCVVAAAAYQLPSGPLLLILYEMKYFQLCIFTVAHDRDSDIEDCYILAVFYLFPTTDFSTSLGRFS